MAEQTAQQITQQQAGTESGTRPAPGGDAGGVGAQGHDGARDEPRGSDRSGTEHVAGAPTGPSAPEVEEALGVAVALEATPAVPGDTASRVGFTAAAVELMRELWREHGPLMFHQSGGCCDGSAPMCFPAGEFRTGDSDVLLGTAHLTAAEGDDLGPVEFWISAEQFEAWRRTRLVIDAVPGRGSGFSLETPTGHRFLTRSELCTVES